MAEPRFHDRRAAGRALARLLTHHGARDDVVVLGLPRGGVPVAYEVARALGVPLDVLVVRKLGLPGHAELAMGAVATGGEVVLHDDVIRGAHVTPDVVARVTRAEAAELDRRETRYRAGRPPLHVEGRTVIVVDDGAATGSSLRAASVALRHSRPARLVAAVPVAPGSTCAQLATAVDELVCATTPWPFVAVGQQYEDFTQTTDDEVCRLLRASWSITPPPSTPEAFPGRDTA